MQDFSDLATAQTGDILVSAYHEPLEADNSPTKAWIYCLRIENNSGYRVKLLKKDFCITDNNGRNYFEKSEGFHCELPILEAGECFEFEDTISINAQAAALYGNCIAQDENGNMLKIKLPIMQLTAVEKEKNIFYH